ncbi:MAG TPA: ribosome-binding factor A [Candidatus Paceibacterota bacterium]|nr:ribosome-binding factor A [Candidatus Paceibacterota bacterium]
MTHRQEKVEGLLQEIIASYLSKEAGTKSFITVTHCDIKPDLKKVTAFISVFPPEHEAEALNFAKRQRPAIRELFKQKLTIKTIPYLEIEIDEGEKNRQKVEAIFNNL